MNPIYLNTVTDRNKVALGLVGTPILTYLLYQFIPEKDKSVINIICIAGFIFSIFGLWIAYVQIMSVKQIANDTHEKVKESIQLNSRILMISDISKKVAMVNEIMAYLRDDKIDICIIKMQDLKYILSSLNNDNYIGHLPKSTFSKAMQNFNNDLSSLHKLHLSQQNTINKELITNNLESLSSMFLSVDAKLKMPIS